MDGFDTYSMEKLERILSTAPCGVGIFTLQHHTALYFNPAYYRLVGYTPEEYASIKGDKKESLLYPEDLKLSDSAMAALAGGEEGKEYTFRILRRGGEMRYVRLSFVPFLDASQSCVLCFFDDVTPEQEKYAQLKLIADNIGSSICVIKFDKNGKQLLYANNQFFHYLGISEKESALDDPSLFDLISITESDRQKTEEALQVALRTGQVQNFSFRLLRKGKEPLWMNHRLAVIGGQSDDSFVMVSASTDISKQKKAQLEVALQQGRYSLVVDELKATVYEIDFERADFYASDSYKEYAFSSLSLEAKLQHMIPDSMVNPEDLEVWHAFCFPGDMTPERLECDVRLLLSGGGYRWCRLIAKLNYDESGKIRRMLGVIIDISDEKEHTIMLSQLLNDLPGGVAVFKIDSSFECLYYNDSFARLSRRTRSELDAFLADPTFVKKLIHPSDLAGFSDLVWAKIRNGEPINLTYRYFTKEGEVKWVHMNATKLREEGGCPVYYCVFTYPPAVSALYRELTDNSNVGIMVSDIETHEVFYANEALSRLLHLETQGCVGRKCHEFINCTALDQKQCVCQRIGYEKGEETIKYFPLIHAYMQVRSVLVKWLDRQVVAEYFDDVTEKYEAELQQRDLLNRVPEGIGIYEVDKDSARQVYMNDRFYAMVGESRNERMQKTGGKGFLNFVHPEDLGAVKELMNSFAHGNQAGYVDHRILCGDGKYHYFHLMASVAKTEGQKLTVYCTYTDYDETMNYRKTLEHSNSMIRKQYQEEQMQRKMLEKDSIINILFDITGNKLVSYRTPDAIYDHYPEGEKGEVIRGSLHSRVFPSDAQKVKDFYSVSVNLALYAKGVAERSVEYRSMQNDGCYHWLRAISRLRTDSETGHILSYTFVHDIDLERKRALAADSIIDEETDYVLLLNLKSGLFRLLRAHSKAYQDWQVLMLTREEILSNVNLERVQSEDREALCRFYEREYLVQNLEINGELSLVTRLFGDGGRMLRMRNSAYYLDETHEDIVLTCRNITDIYEEQVKQKQVLEKALQDANRANQAKSEFLSNMSHDMRTPLNGILGVADLALDEPGLTPAIRSYLSDIHASGNYLLSLINDVLDVSKIEHNAIELHPEPYPYDTFIHDITKMIEPLCQEKHITFSMNPSKECPTIVVDPIRFKQIFINIFSNAVKYTPEGGHIEHYTEAKLIDQNHIDCRCHVKDNGIGMSQEFQKTLFEPFKQEHQEGFAAVQGTGLGLTIANHLASLMGGEISIKSEKGKGTEVIIHTVLEITDRKPDEPQQISDVAIECEVLKGLHILVCEDHPLNAKITCKLLEKCGIAVTLAGNGQEGVSLFASSSLYGYDAILMDIRMPVLDGLEAATAIRALKRDDCLSVPIIAMSANAFDEDVHKSLSAGMNAHLTKPVDPLQLYAVLSSEVVKGRTRAKQKL